MDRSATAEERRHMGKVAALGCIVCLECFGVKTPCQVHHVRVRHGWGRSGHFYTIGLCDPHHTGPAVGVHGLGREEFAAEYGRSEIGFLNLVLGRIGRHDLIVAEELHD